MELSWGLCASQQGGALGWGALEERQQFTGDGLGEAAELGQRGMGAFHQQESLRWEGLKLLLIALLGAAGQCPPLGGLMLEVLCRGDFSTPHDIKFFVWSRAVPPSSTGKVLQCSGCSRDGGGFEL